MSKAPNPNTLLGSNVPAITVLELDDKFVGKKLDIFVVFRAIADVIGTIADFQVPFETGAPETLVIFDITAVRLGMVLRRNDTLTAFDTVLMV